ncbi:MAG: hypothetical protein JWM44_1209 [Bacilli bacterium]|nr:hypothetical protein [Bacilli bacterium]
MKNHIEMTLRQYSNSKELDVPSFLTVAIGLAELVGRLHQAGEMNRTLSPNHLIYNSKTGQFELIDLQTGLSGDATSSYAYMSPEQTGRMKRTIDGRSHLYVLGVIYYELLTGHLPYHADTAAEWVYAHMAIAPEPLSATDATLPSMICDIVIKLLSKPVEERYQSPFGLGMDLKRCLEEWQRTGSVEPFVPGLAYALSHFQIPQALYGREKETVELLAAFERIRFGRMELLLITGAAGCGKTMMVREFKMTVLKQRGYFIAGKFDQFIRDIPNIPFIRAFQDLIRQILAESPERIALWRTKLLEALGQSGAVVAEVIPEVVLIIGKQPPVETLPPAEATRRSQQLFLNFVHVFADSREYPLVLFLDDLQWADLASLRFLRVLLNGPRSCNLLLIGAYRDNEIHESHPLKEIMDEEFDNINTVSHRINFKAFQLSEVRLFVAETLHRDLDECRSLAEALFQQTAGNPYYLTQMLQSLYHDRIIYFNEDTIRCEWDLGAIKEREGSSDVLQLIIERFVKLPERTRLLLRMAACIGNAFPLSLLSSVCEQSLRQTEQDLSAALYEGLVLISNEQQTSYTFLHDKVQQAIYQLLSETEIKENHLAIGRILHQQGSLEQSDDFLLETVYHLNQGSELVTDSTEQRELAELNLRAGRKAKASAAYDTALIILQVGIKLMQAEKWSGVDSLYFDLWLERSECEYYCGNFAQAEEILDQLQEHARSLLDWTNIYFIQITMYAYRNQHDEAIEIGIHAMAEFGLTIPLKPTPVSIIGELLRMRWWLKGRTDPFADLPETQDPHQKALSRIVTAAAPSVTIVNPRLSVILFSKYIRLALKKGGSEFFPLALSSYALMLCLGFGKYKAGLHLSEKALPYLEKLNSVNLKGRTLQILGMILLFNRPQDARSYFKQGTAYSLESGDLLFSGYGVSLHVVNFLGDLRELYPLCMHYVETASRSLDPVTARMLQKTMQYVRMFQGTAVGSLADVINEDGLFPEQNLWIRNHYYYCYTCEIEVRYVFGYYADVIELAKRSEQWEEDMNGNPARKQCYYAFLATTAHYASIPVKDRKKTLKMLSRQLRRMKKWSKNAYDAAMHKYLLMSAEMARLAGKDKQAVRLYDQAMKSAKENGLGLLQYEAIACELAARYYLSKGEDKVAEICMRDACRGYLKWGANGKLQSLCEAYPAWLSEFSEMDLSWMGEDSVAAAEQQATDAESASPFENLSAAPADNVIGKELDVSTIRQAAKIVLDGNADEHQHFPDQFLHLALTNAGAERGCIIRDKGGEWIIEAAKGINRSSKAPHADVVDGDFSAAVVQFVLRTGEPVVLGEALWSMFASDPYMRRKRPRSVLCLPIRYPDHGVGAVYLENNLTADAFTADRLEVLDMVFSRMVHLKSLYEQEDALEDTAEIGETIQVKSHPPLVESLTNREMEILRLMTAGLSNKEIALRLWVTEGTVKNHGINIYGKLQVKRRTQAITKARELHLLE